VEIIPVLYFEIGDTSYGTDTINIRARNINLLPDTNLAINNTTGILEVGINAQSLHASSLNTMTLLSNSGIEIMANRFNDTRGQLHLYAQMSFSRQFTVTVYSLTA
jgi:hypothetical protein